MSLLFDFLQSYSNNSILERVISDTEKHLHRYYVQANPYDKNSEGHATSSIPEVRVGVHYGRVNVVTPDGKPLAGVPVDVLVNGKVVLDSVPTNEGGFREFQPSLVQQFLP